MSKTSFLSDETVARWVRRYVHKAGGVDAVAAEVGCSSELVRQWMDGRSRPSIIRMGMLSDFAEDQGFWLEKARSGPHAAGGEEFDLTQRLGAANTRIASIHMISAPEFADVEAQELHEALMLVRDKRASRQEEAAE